MCYINSDFTKQLIHFLTYLLTYLINDYLLEKKYHTKSLFLLQHTFHNAVYTECYRRSKNLKNYNLHFFAR